MELLSCAVYVALIGLLSNIIGNELPREWFRADRFPFTCFAWENEGRIYQKLNIRAWKDKLPDMSRVVRRMYRKEVDPRADAENLRRLIEESCVAETVHIVLIVLSLYVVKIWKGSWGWFIWLLCLLGNLPFILIQRFNRPRLQKMQARMQARNVL